MRRSTESHYLLGSGLKPGPPVAACPPLGEGHFLLTFCWPGQKVRRLAGRVPPTLFLKTMVRVKTAGPGRQPGGFLCWPKESHQRKGRHSAWGHAVAERAAAQYELVLLLLFTDPHPKAPGPIRLGPRVRCELQFIGRYVFAPRLFGFAFFCSSSFRFCFRFCLKTPQAVYSRRTEMAALRDPVGSETRSHEAPRVTICCAGVWNRDRPWRHAPR